MSPPPRRSRTSPRTRGAGTSPASRRARAGERRPARVLQALSSVNFDRLLPPDDEARARRSARLRRVGGSLAAVVLVVVTVYAVFPVRTGLNLLASTDRARERLEAFQRENALLEEEARALRDDARIEQEARELGLVLPGEESYRILPAPQAPPSSTSTTVPGG